LAIVLAGLGFCAGWTGIVGECVPVPPAVDPVARADGVARAGDAVGTRVGEAAGASAGEGSGAGVGGGARPTVVGGCGGALGTTMAAAETAGASECRLRVATTPPISTMATATAAVTPMAVAGDRRTRAG